MSTRLSSLIYVSGVFLNQHFADQAFGLLGDINPTCLLLRLPSFTDVLTTVTTLVGVEEGRTFIWFMGLRIGSTPYLDNCWSCAGGLSLMNSVGIY